MTILVMQHGRVIDYKSFTFPGGEVQITVIDKLVNVPVKIHADITNTTGIIELLMITDAIRRTPEISEIHLVMPYVPYARQDRVCNPGEALSLKVFCNLINAQGYTSVEVWDVHSDVALALIDRVKNIHQVEFIKTIDIVPGTILVAPDAGAAKKTLYVVQELNKRRSVSPLKLIQASKVRDTRTGTVTDTVVHTDAFNYSFANFLIVDDICDGGRTFIELAKKLQPLTHGSVDLYVTHGIFSQGFDELSKYIRHVYCPNVWPGVPSSPILKRI